MEIKRLTPCGSRDKHLVNPFLTQINWKKSTKTICKALISIFIALMILAPEISTAYRVRYFTYEVINIEPNTITIRSESGKKELIINKDAEKFKLKVGDWVRYNSRYNRLRKHKRSRGGE